MTHSLPPIGVELFHEGLELTFVDAHEATRRWVISIRVEESSTPGSQRTYKKTANCRPLTQ